MTLPCLSRVWGKGERLYFFIQMQRPYEVFYAVAQRIGDEWKVTFVGPEGD